MKTIVYCDTTTEIGRHMIESSIWKCVEEDFFCCDPKNIEFVTDGISVVEIEKLKSSCFLNSLSLDNYIHFAELEEIISREDCSLIIDLSRLNHPEGTRGKIQNYINAGGFRPLLEFMPWPEIICIYETKGIYSLINEFGEKFKNSNLN